ncbi:MAG: hypothetical protein HWD84_03235 [Flavobacteriaceae bacterium]|jgi:hypothetical protein|nr:hypothetical protein [Flavobacteriaceae bacterium]NVJ72471.1 hypothetical protein [Flavobacteriaceae bacterium]
MKTILFPHSYKKWSSIIFYTTLIFGSYIWFSETTFEFFNMKVFSVLGDDTILRTETTENIIGNHALQWIDNNVLDELLTLIIVISGLMASFSREPIEDELIAKLRMDSLTTSLYINYGILLLATLFVYELTYFHVMVVQLFLIILVFNLIFKYKLHQHYKD